MTQQQYSVSLLLYLYLTHPLSHCSLLLNLPPPLTALPSAWSQEENLYFLVCNVVTTGHNKTFKIWICIYIKWENHSLFCSRHICICLTIIHVLLNAVNRRSLRGSRRQGTYSGPHIHLVCHPRVKCWLLSLIYCSAINSQLGLLQLLYKHINIPNMCVL